MKKIIALLLTLALSACALVSCFGHDEPDNGGENNGGNIGGGIISNGSDNAAADKDWDLLG